MAQAWSRYLYEKFETVEKASEKASIDGLLYNAAHNDERAVALYERASDTVELTREIPIDGRAIRSRLLRLTIWRLM